MVLYSSEEIYKIKKIFNNKNFQSNPIESLKTYIRNNQILNERNTKIEENFNKNYNMLGIKK